MVSNPPARIFKVYVGALPGFGHIYHPDGLNSTLFSQACILEMAASMGVSRTDSPRTGEGVQLSGQPLSYPLDDLLQQMHMLYFAQSRTNPLSCSKNFSVMLCQVSPMLCTSHPHFHPCSAQPCPGHQSSVTLVFVMKLDAKFVISTNRLSKLLPLHLSKLITTPQPFSDQTPSDS